MDTTRPGQPTGNRTLDALPTEVRQRILAQLTPVNLPIKTVLFEPGETVHHVHFPVTGVVSLVTPLEDGDIVEVATVGNEGIVGVPLHVGGSLSVRAISQVAGIALRMNVGLFLAEMARVDLFRRLVQNYVQALFGQIAQAAACNRLHSNEEPETTPSGCLPARCATAGALWHTCGVMAQEARLGDQGRLVIPAAARRALGLRAGDVLSVRVEADHLVLERRAAVLARLRERFTVVPDTVSLVDELLADRREEAHREQAE